MKMKKLTFRNLLHVCIRREGSLLLDPIRVHWESKTHLFPQYPRSSSAAQQVQDDEGAEKKSFIPVKFLIALLTLR